MNEKIKILVIEDDPIWSIFVENIIKDSQHILLGSANSILKAKAMIDGHKPDVIVSDIMLSSTPIFTLLDCEDYRAIPTILMTTFISEESYEQSRSLLKATYLPKPFHKYTLLSTLELLLARFPINNNLQEDKFITVKGIQEQEKKILLSNIVWIQAEGNYSFIYTNNNRKYARKKSLTQLMTELDIRFIRIHKAYSINSNYIQRIDMINKLVLIHDTRIPIGRTYKDVLKPFFDD